MGAVFLVLVNMLIQTYLVTHHRRNLKGKALKDKVGDQLGGFWFGLIKWTVIAGAAFGAWRFYKTEFLTASASNQLLGIIALLLFGILWAVLRVGDEVKKLKR